MTWIAPSAASGSARRARARSVRSSYRVAPDDVVVRTPYSGVSRGTDTLIFRGGVPESQFTVMRAPFRSLEVLADEGEVIELSAFDALITDERYFEDLPRLMPRLAGGELSALCVRVVYGQG